MQCDPFKLVELTKKLHNHFLVFTDYFYGVRDCIHMAAQLQVKLRLLGDH